jgi:hypothetical protein
MTSLEKAARSVAETQVACGQSPHSGQLCAAIARAVLLAVRELDEVTLKAGWGAETKNYTCPYPDEAWPAMIDAILQEKGDG